MNYSTLKVALIADVLTQSCLSKECAVKHVTPENYRSVLGAWKPDLLFVESAWHGYEFRWKYKIVSYKEPWRTNRKLRRVVEFAKDLGVPTVFWNKEDGVHFDKFIGSASFFEYIFTVDEGCVERYKKHLGSEVVVNTLMFPVQPTIHYFSGFNFKLNRANFVGSYLNHIHDKRRAWQHKMFRSASGIGVTVFDRNSEHKSENYRYPEFNNLEVRAAVPHVQTASIYKDYLVSLNVNTIENSNTMYSRRLVEILACGGIAVTNPTQAVSRYFEEYCHVIRDEESLTELFSRLKRGPNQDDLMRARAGAEYVEKEHTWAHRLQEVAHVLGL